MPGTFDPEYPDVFVAEALDVVVTDPDGHPNKVLQPAMTFKLDVTWKTAGSNSLAIPLGVDASSGNNGWHIMVHAESFGAGPERSIYEAWQPVSGFTTDADGDPVWEHNAEITPAMHQLAEHYELFEGERSSGVYKLLVTVFMNWGGPAGMGEDIIGFTEERMILMESSD